MAVVAVAALLSVGADDTGCQSQDSASVDQDRILSTYWLLYDEESDNRFNFIRIDQRDLGATSVAVPADTLGNLVRGDTIIGLRRHRGYPLDESASAGGKITTTLQSALVDFELQ